MCKIKKAASVLLSLILIFSLFSFQTLADGASVTADSGVQMLEAEFTVNVKFEQEKLGSLSDANVTYDSNRLKLVSVSSAEGGVANSDKAGNIILSYFDPTGVGATNSVSFQIKFKAIATGDAKISTKGIVENADFTANSSQSKSLTVTIKEKQKLSDNANLKTMYLSNDIPLSPEFSKDITTYNIKVENSVEKVLINAVQEDADAKISYGGSTKMKVGENQRWVLVTAPSGAQKKYVINITRAAPDQVENPDDENNQTKNPYEVVIDEKTWIINKEYTEDIIPSGFTVSSAVIDGVELPVLKSDVTSEIVVFAVCGEESGYFKLNELTGAFAVYRIVGAEDTSGVDDNPSLPQVNEITLSPDTQGKYVLLNIEDNLILPDGYYKTTARIGGFDLTVIKYNDSLFSDFLIVYAQAENGTKEFYRIDAATGSMQRFPEFSRDQREAVVMANGTFVTKFIALSNMEKLMICALLLFGVLVIILVICLIIKLVKAHRDSVEIMEFDELDDYEDDFDDEESEETADFPEDEIEESEDEE